MNLFLIDFYFNTFKDVILHKYSTLMLLRFIHEDVEDMWPKDQDTVQQMDQSEVDK
jgi:hypothetical protein